MAEALVKLFKDFIFRDLLYILGGITVMLSYPYTYHKIVNKCSDKYSVFVILYFVGLAYILGWCIQTLFAIVHLVTTSQSYWPKAKSSKRVKFLYQLFKIKDKFPGAEQRTIRSNFVRILYRLFMFEKVFPNELLPKIGQDEKLYFICENAQERSIAENDRFVHHLQIGTTFGPCLVVAGFIRFLFGCAREGCIQQKFGMALIQIVFGVILILLSWIMIIRLRVESDHFYEEVKKKLESKK